MATIGFIGLGLMGGRMAARLLAAGHRLVVHNRTQDKAGPLLDCGAGWADVPSAAVREADVIWTMLSTPDVVEALATGECGFLAAARAGAIWVDSSTVDPATSRRMARAAAARGVRFLDAPVSGSTGAAETGALLMLVGGDAADVEAMDDMLYTVGRKVIHAGDHGQGSALKLVFNQLLGTAILAAAEAVVLGRSLGIDRDALFSALEDCGALPPGLRERVRSSLDDGRHEPGFPLRWIEKDLRLASHAVAGADAALPLTDAARAVYGLACAHGWGRQGITAVCEFLGGHAVPADVGRRSAPEPKRLAA